MDKSNFKGREDDHRALVFMLLDEIRPRKIVRDVIHAAYDAGYERLSDGITLMPELAFSGFNMKHPAGVGHDWLYYMGTANPFLPKIINTQWQARLWADNFFKMALIDFGHPYRARIYWIGLRAGGWYGWRKHRKAGHPFTSKIDKETGNLK